MEAGTWTGTEVPCVLSPGPPSMVHPRKMTIATLLMVPEKPLFMVPSISAHGVPSAIASIRAAIRIPIAALTLHLEMRKIINRITSAKTISTYDVDIKPTLPNLYFTAGFLFIRYSWHN